MLLGVEESLSAQRSTPEGSDAYVAEDSSTELATALGIIGASLTFGINPSLEQMQRICSLLGHPEQQFVCIQVAGTNGKSSTSRYLAAILRAFGYSTGLYTSPELIDLTERIEIEGIPVDEASLARAVLHVHETAAADGFELTEFELITAAALVLFAERGVRYAVLEVGLGGRWDATTVVQPRLVVLTGVDLDHTAILGDTLEQIADEKAAIIKHGVSVVAAPTHREVTDLFQARAAREHARFIAVPAVRAQEFHSYQAQNKLTALTAARELLGDLGDGVDFDEARAQAALDATVVPGRLEIVRTDPLILIDAAHNPASACVLARALRPLPEGATLLLAVLADKDAAGIIEALTPSFTSIALTQTASPRAMPARELADLVQAITNRSFMVFESPELALIEFIKRGKSPIVATGSITLAAAVKDFLLKLSQSNQHGNQKED